MFIFYVPGIVLEVADPKVNKIRHCPCPHRNYNLVADISLTQNDTNYVCYYDNNCSKGVIESY